MSGFQMKNHESILKEQLDILGVSILMSVC